VSNQQPVVEIKTDEIIASAKKAYAEFEKGKQGFYGKNAADFTARNAAEHVPELLRLLIEQDEQIQYLKQENEDHLTARENMSYQLAETLACLHESENH